MKKFVFSLVLVFVTVISVGAADYYSVGVDAFNKGAYAQASSNLKHAVKINPKNVSARYYLAQVYLKQNQIEDAVEQYNRIILIAPDSVAAVKSQKGLSLIKTANSTVAAALNSANFEQYKDNYFDYVLTPNGQISKWQTFPVAVYIQPSPFKKTAQLAFKQWQEKSKNLVIFNYVNTPEVAQIKVLFKNSLESTSTKDNFFAGFSKPVYESGYLKSSEINVLTVNPQNGSSFDANFIYATTLHELGHSLGFVGHSPDSNDVMASFSKSPKLELTKRDLNTLNLVYRMDAKTLASRSSQGVSVKMRQAQEYIKNSPNKSIGWSNLGDIYVAKKMYSSAINSYKKAAALEPDRASIFSSLGTAYKLSGDKQNAYLSFKQANTIEPENDLYKRQYQQICAELGKALE